MSGQDNKNNPSYILRCIQWSRPPTKCFLTEKYNLHELLLLVEQLELSSLKIVYQISYAKRASPERIRFIHYYENLCLWRLALSAAIEANKNIHVCRLYQNRYQPGRKRFLSNPEK